jgi:8-amino-7-oxononanoate synthase
MEMEQRLAKRKQFGNLRTLPRPVTLIDFASNDYLGLARSMHCDELGGFGSTGSRLLTGNSPYAEELEQRIAHFHGQEAGTLFSCGYMANVGLLSIISGIILFDERVHASTRDGIRLSRAQSYPFRHNDVEHLEQRLKMRSREDCFIAIESVYSTDGSLAPLKEICALSERYGAHLIVDEAHAVGVFGPQGRGLVSENRAAVFAQVITFGKALGTFGAIVLGSPLLKQALINFATSFVYTTALPLHCLAAIERSYATFPHMEKERTHLRSLFGNRSQIQAVCISGNERVKQAAAACARRGFDVRPLLSPTVQRGEECLRICLHAFNSKNDLHTLMEILHG